MYTRRQSKEGNGCAQVGKNKRREEGLLRLLLHDAQGWRPCACSSRQAAPCKCWHNLPILPFTWSSGLSIGDVETDSSEKNCECVD